VTPSVAAQSDTSPSDATERGFHAAQLISCNRLALTHASRRSMGASWWLYLAGK